ncbi:DUF3131 domain-containing protein [Arenibacterium sp. LLYu02]|uniref:DUF3131 domain-containing protein n=1 Tax=Arenibacterium sp. LLYu02 TaxID=3404132 RepID=UPI003B2236C1
MKRRQFLKTAMAGTGIGLLPMAGTASSFRGAVAPQGYPVIADVDHRTNFSHLIALIDAFGARAIPVTCLVSPYDAAGRPLGPGSDLGRLLSGFLLGGNSFEVAPYLPDLAGLSQHFQARAAHDVVRDLRALLAPVEQALARPVVFHTLGCGVVDRPTSPEALRSAGITNVLTRPNRSAAVSSETWDNGVARLFGGTLCDLDTPPEAPASEQITQSIFYLSAANLGALPLEEVSQQAERFAEALSQHELEGSYSLLPVSDLQLRDSYQFKRFLCLHLVEPLSLSGAEPAAYEALRDLLKTLGIPHSHGSALGPEAGGAANGLWVATEAAPDGSQPEAIPVRFHDRPGAETPEVETARPLPAGIGLRPSAVAAEGGFGRDGTLTIPHRAITAPLRSEDLAQVFDGLRDVMVELHPAGFTSLSAREALAKLLQQLPRDGISAYVTVDTLARLVAPKGALPLRYRRTEAASPALLPLSQDRQEVTADALIEDAKIAWRYLQTYTHPETGLCPATVHSVPGGRKLEAVTMWDVGSQINALVAAHQIGLIDDKARDKAVSRILPNIAGRVSDERRLPQGWIRTDRTRWGNRDFDGSDAGRLLASLDNLRRNSGFGDQLAELVASYDFDQVIEDGELHSVIEGELKSSYISHSAHYVARAFHRWGITLKSPYDVFADRSEVDGRMALLESAARIGPYGAEPLLLEAMELGMSPESAYLAEVLFAAQLEDYNATARLICVSEGPINESPWFLYQGLRLDAEERTWSIDTPDMDPIYRTPDYLKDHLVLSSKAAFLWSAYKPHSHSERLRNYVRNAAVTNYGFASSIYLKTGLTTENYSDLNTNSIILQAIAHRLKAMG